jgi:hypothetical protein
MALVLLA